METFEIIAAALFLALVMVKKWNIALRINRWRNADPQAACKPFDCLPCFTWWVSLPIAAAIYWIHHGLIIEPTAITLSVVSTMAAFVAAFIIDKL